jgi:hypothetical protein
MAQARGYTASRYLVEVNGKSAGYVGDASGGEPVVAVAETPAAGSGVIKKTLADVSYTPIVLNVSTGAAKELYDWIASVPTGKQKPHDGALVMVDHTNREQARLKWTDGLITEIVFPALAAGSKDPVAIVVAIQPRVTNYITGSGAKHASFSTKTSQKRFQASNFRVSISGLPTFSTHVSDVAPISVRQEIDASGGTPQPGALHIGHVELTGGEPFAADVRSWMDDYVVKHQDPDKLERSLTIDLLGPNLADTLLTLSFKKVGIYALAAAREELASAAIARLRAGLYAEELKLSFDPLIVGTTAAAPPAEPPAQATTEALTTDAFLDAWRTGVRIARAPAAREAIAARLRDTAPAPAPLEGVAAREEEGRSFGEVWAREIGSLLELDVVTELDGVEWTTAKLPDNHSLLLALNRAGVAADAEVTSLSDDPFIRGVVAGAARVRRDLDGLLKQ